MDFNELFDRLWGSDGVNPFGDPFKLEEFMGSQGEIETETCEFVKGDFKTIITCKFNKKGYLIGTSAVSTYIGKGDDLEEILKKALEREDYELAAAVKRRIDAGTNNREEQDNSGS